MKNIFLILLIVYSIIYNCSFAVPGAAKIQKTTPAKQSITYHSKIVGQICQLFYGAHFLRTMSPIEEFTWVEENGSVRGISATNCKEKHVNDALFGLKNNNKDDIGYVEIYWGAYTQLPPSDSFAALNVTTDISKIEYHGSKTQNYQIWVGFQPALDLLKPPSSSKTFTYDRNYKWGNLALASSIQNGVLHNGYHVFNFPLHDYYHDKWNINNSITDEGIINSLADKFTETNEKEIIMGVRHLSEDQYLPSHWEIETKTTKLSQIFVFSDNAFKVAFKQPDFCINKRYCSFRVGLLEHEINLPNKISLSDFDAIFPKGKVRITMNQSTSMNKNGKMKWSFPEGTEIIGKLFGDKVIFSLSDFKKYLEENHNIDQEKYAKMKKIYCFLKNTKKIQIGNEFIWQFPDKNDLNCSL